MQVQDSHKNPSAVPWVAAAIGMEASAAAAALAWFGAGERGTDIALQATARISFLLFWLAYTGAALVTLFGRRFLPIKRRGRVFGLAFAAGHLVHMALVAWLCWIGAAPSAGAFAFFGVALVWIYAFALVSFNRWQRMLGDKGWHAANIIGMNYIAFAFAADFLNHPASLNIKYLIEYTPVVILSLLGPIIYVTAKIRQTRDY